MLSVIVAPVETQQRGLTILAVALGGLAVAGGIVYLAEKLINLAKRVTVMVFELIVEKYKEHRFDAGRKTGRLEGREEGLLEGREEGLLEGRGERQREWQAWYERQQAALRAGQPFDEPPPGYDPADHTNGRESG